MLQTRSLATRIIASLDGVFVNGANRAVSTSLPRFFSTDDAKPENVEAPAAVADEGTPEDAPAAAPTETEETPESTGPTQADFRAQGYSKRQAAWLSPDPEKQKHFLPTLSRKERGSYGSEAAAAQFGAEIDLYPRVPDVPLYNLREVVPEMVQPQSIKFEALKAFRAEHPHATIEELAASIGVALPPPREPPFPGAEPILQWESRLVLSAAVAGEAHPLNKKAKCKVHLRALQRQCALSDAALQHIAEIAGPRYDRKTGVLTLTSDRYLERELNRDHIVGMLDALVDEGKKMDAASASVQQR